MTGRMRRFILPLSLLMSLILGLSACGKSSVLATVNQQKITQKEFAERLAKLPEPYQAMARGRPRAFLDDWITELLLFDEAKRRGLAHSRVVQELAEEAHHKIMVAKLVDEEVEHKIVVKEGEIAQYYQENQKSFAMPERFRARHILVETEAKASEILSLIKSGADFAKVAQQESIDPSREHGGDIGAFSRGQLIKEFEDAVTALEVGQTSGIVRSQFGYHVIQLTEKLPARTLTLDEVRDQIVQDLRSDKKREALLQFADDLRKRARIVVREDLVTAFQKNSESLPASESAPSSSSSSESAFFSPHSP